MKLKCIIADCEKNQGSSREMCDMHYKRWQRHGNVDICLNPVDGTQGCRVIGCEKKHKAHGYCQSHYKFLILEDASTRPQCQVAGCAKATFAYEMCKNHYQVEYFRDRLAYFKRMESAALGGQLTQADTFRAIRNVARSIMLNRKK